MDLPGHKCQQQRKDLQSALPHLWYAVLLVLSLAAEAAEDDLRHRATLTDGLGGTLQAFAARGVELGALYTGEISRVRGGIDSGRAYEDNVDVTLQADLETLFGIEGGTFLLYVVGDSGTGPTRYAGDYQEVSNIDSQDTWKLYELWYQQNWHDDRYSVKAGLYDFNSEFDSIDTAGFFINSSHGIGAEIAQTGENGPSIFPTTALGLRGRFNLDDRFYIQAVVLDGVPGLPDKPNGTHVKLGRDDGLFVAAELAYMHHPADGDSRPYRKFTVGTWRYTSALTSDSVGNAISPRENRGIYASIDSSLYAEVGDSSQGLSGYLRYGVADERLNQLGAYFGGGLVYTGLLPGRDQDQFGIAFANARNSHHYRSGMHDLGTPVEAGEVALEVSYSAQVLPWLMLQPDYQYVIDPGMDPSIDAAHVFMLRFEVAL